MALLGAQLVITLVVVSVIQKVSPHFSFARYILCSTGLIRYLYPTDQELKTLARVPKEKPKKGKHAQENGFSSEVFHVPRNLDIELESSKVTEFDVVHLKYYTDYQWLLDFTVYSVIVYTLTEIYSSFYPLKNEINLSVLWCALVLGFAFKILLTLWVQYFKGEESVGERSTCIVTGFAYLLVAMVVLIIDEKNLEIGLDKAYSSFNHSASLFLDNQGLSSSGPASKIVIKFFLAIWCGLLGSLFTFPGLRMAKMHWDTLKYCQDRKLLILLANLSYASPLILVCLWIKPISRDYLTVRVFSGMSGPLMSAAAFESSRLIAVVVAVVLKFSLMPLYLQSYLNLALQRLEIQKKESGRITNKEFQKKIAAVFYYLCAVTLQYLAPIIICLFFTFMYKTLGDYTWEGVYTGASSEECSIDPSKEVPTPELSDNIKKSSNLPTEDLQLALNSLRQIFTTDVFRGLLGLATWWSCFSLFATSSMGMVYQSYFANA